MMIFVIISAVILLHDMNQTLQKKTTLHSNVLHTQKKISLDESFALKVRFNASCDV